MRPRGDSGDATDRGTGPQKNTHTVVLASPQQVIKEREGRKAYQSQVAFEEGKLYLLRAIVLDAVEPALVVTAYCTSRIRKYWRES